MIKSTENLIKRSKKGDKQAFGELVLLYGEYVFSLVFRMVTIDAVAEDITQDVFVRAWKNIHKYEISKSKITTWLFTIASRLSLDYLRSHKNTQTINDDFDLAYNDEEVQDNKELGQLIRKASRELSDTQKLVFTLRDLEDLDVSEVVSITGFSEKKIKDNLYVARKRVREKVEFYLKIV